MNVAWGKGSKIIIGIADGAAFFLFTKTSGTPAWAQ